MRFALVIPVLNEEGAVAGTLTRALAAREKVLSETPVTEMTVVLVNDGSTDRTQAIVDGPEFDEVVKVRFPKNRGYGAAIQAGWRRAADAELLGFIDGDGTCDPNYCVPLINRMLETGADVVLLARLNPDSRMPMIRKAGNLLFARLLGVLSRKSLTDCASGFRVVKRTSLRLISPLPNALHFTPAMSAICLLDPRLRIEEVSLPYEERIGRSKLRVIKDGLRFLYIILFTTCCYAPFKMMLAAAALWVGLVGLMMFSLRRSGASALAPEMLALAGITVAWLAIWTGVICHQLNFLLIGPRRRIGLLERSLQRVIEYKRLISVGIGLFTAGLAGLLVLDLILPGAQLRFWLGLSFLLVSGAICALSGIVVRVAWAVGEKQKALLATNYIPALVGDPARGRAWEPGPGHREPSGARIGSTTQQPATETC